MQAGGCCFNAASMKAGRQVPSRQADGAQGMGIRHEAGRHMGSMPYGEEHSSFVEEGNVQNAAYTTTQPTREQHTRPAPAQQQLGAGPPAGRALPSACTRLCRSPPPARGLPRQVGAAPCSAGCCAGAPGGALQHPPSARLCWPQNVQLATSVRLLRRLHGQERGHCCTRDA